MKRVIALTAVSLLFSACDGLTTDPITPDLPNAEISDAAHNQGVSGFYFLAPMVPNPTTLGTFNPLVRPRVLICEFDTITNACVTTVAEYTVTSGTDGNTISISTTDEHYKVNWDTQNFTLDTDATYRIGVFLTEYPGALRLGYADVELGANKGQLKSVNTDEYIPLVNSETLPIKFRIENGAGCAGQLDCGSGTVGPEGGIVTTANGAAGVSVPAGAVDHPITIKIRQLDPAQQPGGLCLPTGIRQDGACYDFDTVEEISTVQDDGSNTFNGLVTVAICPSPNAVRPERLTLHKYNPERFGTEGVVELPNAEETFLRCDGMTGPGYAAAGASILGRLAGVARRALSPVASVLFPGDLHAKDIGRAGLTDSFSRITWAESIDLAYSGAPGSADPGEIVQFDVSAATAHNDQHPAVAGTDAQLRVDYTDPAGATAAWYETTGAQGSVALSWPLTQATGVHTLVISSRDTDPSLMGDPLIEDPTAAQTVQLIVCPVGVDCGLGTVDGTGGTVTTGDGTAGVSVPAGAVTSPVTIVITEIDPSTLPGGRCLPTGIRQDGACYDFDTLEEISDVTGGSTTFLQEVTVGICPSPDAIREDYLTLHKYNPELPLNGVIELPNVGETFLTCPTSIATEPSGFFGRLAHAAGRALAPVASVLAPRDLYATDIGRAGLTDSFSRISWAEPLTIATSGLPATAAPGETITGPLVGTTAHNHADAQPTNASGATLRFDYTDPAGTVSEWNSTTDANGLVSLNWPLTHVEGIHTLVISTRARDADLAGHPLIEDPTVHVTLLIEVVAGGGDDGTTVDQVSDAVTSKFKNLGVGNTGSFYQTFTPAASNLASVQLRLRAGGSFPPAGYESEVNIRSGTLGGPILATFTAFIPGPVATGTSLEVMHEFAGGVAVTPGQTYVIEWKAAESPVLGWFIADGNPYAAGDAYASNQNLLTGDDFMFRTFTQ